jgi:hypothetical protein
LICGRAFYSRPRLARDLPAGLTPLPGPAATTAVPAKTAASAGATATAAFTFRPGFVDVERSATQIGAVERGDRAIRFRSVAHLYERKPAGTACVPVRHQAYAVNFSMRFKQSPDGGLGCREIQVPYKNVLH